MCLKVIYLSDILIPPFDEGAKVVGRNLFKQLENVVVIDSLIEGDVCSLSTIGKLMRCKAEYILYLPAQSITFNSFLRAKLINFLSRKKVILLSMQPRNFSHWQKKIICKIQPYKIFVQSQKTREELIRIGLKNVYINSWGVNLEKFRPINTEEKIVLRKKYNIPVTQNVYLHFGHLNKNRNFEELEYIIEADKNNYVLIVCSTTTKQKKELRKRLEGKGFHFLTEFIENYQELYQLADYYCHHLMHNNCTMNQAIVQLFQNHLQDLNLRQ